MRQRFARGAALSIILAGAVVACGPAGSPSGGQAGGGDPRSATPKRITLAIIGDPVTVFPGIDQRQASASAELQDLVNARFTRSDHEDVLYPQLAEAVPTIENGLWKVSPDGTMETTYRLSNAVVWHDGTPLTTDDFAFSLKVQQDQDLAFFGNVVLSYIDAVNQPDPRTISFHWKRLYINADGLTLVPMPKHVVEPSYLQNKQSLLELPVWSTESVGSGAFRVKEFQRGSHAVLEAFDRYVLGRPKIDTITAKFIQDQNTVTANLLAGAVDATIGRGISIEQAVTMRNQWPEGRIAELLFHSWVRVHPQFINPTPAVILEVPFRQALLHAVDRQQIIDTVQEGVGAISEIGLSTNSPYYQTVESSVVKYPYDPRKAAQLLEGLGYTRGPDGMLFDRAGARLSVELRTTADNAARVKSMQVIADDWQKAGVAVEQVIVPAQLQGDRAFRQERTGFEVNRVGADLNGITSYHTRSVQTAANNYRPSGGGTNYPRYSHPELDEIIDRFERTIPMTERLQVAGQAFQHMTSRVVQLGMYYDVQPTMVHNRVSKNFIGYTWDAHEWDVTG